MEGSRCRAHLASNRAGSWLGTEQGVQGLHDTGNGHRQANLTVGHSKVRLVVLVHHCQSDGERNEGEQQTQGLDDPVQQKPRWGTLLP